MSILPNPFNPNQRSDLRDVSLELSESRDVIKKGNKWCVISETTGRSFGCYKTKKEAVERLRQVKGHGSPYKKGGKKAGLKNT